MTRKLVNILVMFSASLRQIYSYFHQIPPSLSYLQKRLRGMMISRFLSHLPLRFSDYRLPKSISSTLTIPSSPLLSFVPLSPSPCTPKNVAIASSTTPSNNPSTSQLNPSPASLKSEKPFTSSRYVFRLPSPSIPTMKSSPKTSNAFGSGWKWILMPLAAASNVAAVISLIWVQMADFQSEEASMDGAEEGCVTISSGRFQNSPTEPSLSPLSCRQVLVRCARMASSRSSGEAKSVSHGGEYGRAANSASI